MENIPILIALVLSLTFTGYLLYGIFLLVSGTLKGFRDNLVLHFQESVSGSLKEDYESHLAHKFSYYDKLPEKLKVKFLVRIRNFLSEKTFEGRDQLEITDEKKILVAASAVQLTFGLNNYVLSRFSKIILYPVSFYSRTNDAWHMGETNARGILVLSWEDLQEGFNKKDDAFNVGLHEMAHALEIQYMLKDDYDFFFGNYFAKWSRIAEEEFQNLQDKRESFFRKYAGVNRHELFAVSIEYFFEASAEFKSRLPQMYYHLCILLNQDPLSNDASVAEQQRKTQVELKAEIHTLPPLMTTDYSYGQIFLDYGVLLFAFSVLAIQGFKSTTFLLYLSVLAGVFTAILIFFRLNKIILFENYLAVMNAFGTIKKVYELDEIISFEFSDSSSRGNSFRALLAKNGKIISHSHGYLAASESMQLLKQKLKEKNILVR